MMRCAITVAFILIQGVVALDNGLAKTPPMVRSCSAPCRQFVHSLDHIGDSHRVYYGHSGLDVMGALQMRDRLRQIPR